MENFLLVSLDSKGSISINKAISKIQIDDLMIAGYLFRCYHKVVYLKKDIKVIC